MIDDAQKRKVNYNIMNKNLLIIGAGMYDVVASEIAADMRYFEKISLVNDERKVIPNGMEIIGTS